MHILSIKTIIAANTFSLSLALHIEKMVPQILVPVVWVFDHLSLKAVIFNVSHSGI